MGSQKKYPMHNKQISSGVQLVLFRNDLQGPRFRKVLSRIVHKFVEVKCGITRRSFRTKAHKREQNPIANLEWNNWHAQYVQSNSERRNGLCREARMSREWNEISYEISKIEFYKGELNGVSQRFHNWDSRIFEDEIRVRELT